MKMARTLLAAMVAAGLSACATPDPAGDGVSAEAPTPAETDSAGTIGNALLQLSPD